MKIILLAAAAALLAPLAAQASTLPTAAQALHALRAYERALPVSKRNGETIQFSAPGLSGNKTVVCHTMVPYFAHGRKRIMRSKPYTLAKKRCVWVFDTNDEPSLRAAIKLGLVKADHLSKYVTRASITSMGRKHLQAQGGRFTAFVAYDMPDKVLSVKSSENPYQVPAAKVTFRIRPEATKWAKSKVGPHKAIRLSEQTSQGHAVLWKTDHGWQALYAVNDNS